MQAFCSMAKMSCMLQASPAIGSSHVEDCQNGNTKKKPLFLSVKDSKWNINIQDFVTIHEYVSHILIFLKFVPVVD